MTGVTMLFADLDEAALQAVATQLAPAVRHGGTIHLVGDLGAGKTTFARALLQALGVGERVKSPTYSLIESYQVGDLAVHHLDLYRIADAGELDWLGLDDLWGPGSLALIEWPEHGAGALPPPDLELRLRHAGVRRTMEAVPTGERGRQWLAAMGAA